MLPAVSVHEEYDVALGRGRWVATYDARRHTYVMRYVQPLVLTGCDPADPDAALEPEPELMPPSPRTGWQQAVAAMAEQTQADRRQLLECLRQAGHPLTRKQMAKRLNRPRHWVENHLPKMQEIVCVGHVRRAKLYTLAEMVGERR